MVTAAAQSQKYVGIKDAATWSGLSEATIRRMIRAGKLTKFMPTPGKIVVDIRELDNAIRATAGTDSSRGVHLIQSSDEE